MREWRLWPAISGNRNRCRANETSLFLSATLPRRSSYPAIAPWPAAPSLPGRGVTSLVSIRWRSSSAGLDLYLWLTYRTFGLKRPLRLTWRQLYRQFGVDPARANDKFTIRNFRTDCLRELKKIKNAWPDLHYQTVKGALRLSPSPPRIAPSQLRLVE